MRLAASWLLATNGQTNWPKKERVTTPYKAAVETCKAIISFFGSFILRAKGGERWPDVVTPPQGWDEKDERWMRATPILARPHVLRRSGRQWFCEACDKRASGGAAKSKLVWTECVGHPATALGEHARPQCHLLAQTGSFVWCCRCGARAAKFAKKLGEPCVGHSRVCAKHSLAVERLARIPMTRNAYSCSQEKSSGVGDVERASSGTARRLLLKTVCSGAPRTKEYERALSLLGKGQHPKSSVLLGHPSPISDAEWTSGIRTTAICFSVCGSCRVLEPSIASTPRARLCVTCQRRRQKQKHTQTHTNTHQHTHTRTHTHTHTHTHTPHSRTQRETHVFTGSTCLHRSHVDHFYVPRLGPLPGGHDSYRRGYMAQSKGLILKIQKTVEVLQVQFVTGACDAECRRP